LRYIIIILLSVFLLTGCHKTEALRDTIETSTIRIQNESENSGNSISETEATGSVAEQKEEEIIETVPETEATEPVVEQLEAEIIEYAPETEQPEEQIISEICDTTALEAVLAEKTFDESLKTIILDTYKMIWENYDSVYAYKKMDKEKFLQFYCNTIQERLFTGDYVTEDEQGSETEHLLKRKGAVGLTDEDAIYMLPDNNGNIYGNMIHEIAHLWNQDLQVRLCNEGIDIGVVIREGISARYEDFTANLPVKQQTKYLSRTGSIKIYQEKLPSGYGAVYPVYETIAEHLELLLGMEPLIELVTNKGDFIYDLREMLREEFDTETVDTFLKHFVLAASFAKTDGIQNLEYYEARIRNIDYHLTETANLLRLGYGRTYTHHEKMITSIKKQIAVDKEEYENVCGDDTLPRAEKQATLDYLDSYIKMYSNKVKALEYFLYTLTDYDREDIMQFEAEVDQLKITTYEEAGRNEGQVLLDTYLEFTCSVQDILAIRIRNAKTNIELEELKEAAEYYHNEVMFNVYYGDKREENASEKHYQEVVVPAIAEKETSPELLMVETIE